MFQLFFLNAEKRDEVMQSIKTKKRFIKNKNQNKINVTQTDANMLCKKENLNFNKLSNQAHLAGVRKMSLMRE